MPRPKGRLILPDSLPIRFRLSGLPDDVRQVSTPAPVARRATYALVWLAFCGACLVSSQAGALPAAWLALSGALGVGGPKESQEPVGTRQRSSLASRPSARTLADQFAVAADPRRAAQSAAVAAVPLGELPPVRRLAPRIHGGGLGEQRSSPLRGGDELREFAGPSSDELDEPQRESNMRTSERPATTSDRATVAAAARPEPRGSQPAPLVERELATPRREVPPPPEAPRSARPLTVSAGTSCEAAYASFQHTMDFSSDRSARAPSGPDVPREAFAGVLEDFRHYDRCPMNFEVDVSLCVAVLDGKAHGVTVKTHPGNARLAQCLAGVVRGLRFPKSQRMDLVRTELTVR